MEGLVNERSKQNIKIEIDAEKSRALLLYLLNLSLNSSELLRYGERRDDNTKLIVKNFIKPHQLNKEIISFRTSKNLDFLEMRDLRPLADISLNLEVLFGGLDSSGLVRNRKMNVYEEGRVTENLLIIEPLMGIQIKIHSFLTMEEFQNNAVLQSLSLLIDHLLENNIIYSPLSKIITGLQYMIDKIDVNKIIFLSLFIS